jgi:hypothetical protein
VLGIGGVGFVFTKLAFDAGGGIGFILVLWIFDDDWTVGGKIGAFIWGEYWVGGVEEVGGKVGGLIPFAAVEWDIGGKI